MEFFRDGWSRDGGDENGKCKDEDDGRDGEGSDKDGGDENGREWQ